MKIGYIGLGTLGSELARRFLPEHELCVWDINASAAGDFEKVGARVAPTAAELARQSDVVLLCLPRSSDVRDVVFRPSGLAEGLSTGKLVIDQTSGIATETREMAHQLAGRGVAMMDAAVSASPHIVAQGGATIMASGPDDVYERALPVLQVITQTVYRCGTRVGDGQAMKMVNNAMNAGCRLGTLELVAMGRKAGLSLECMTEVLNQGGARNQTTEKMLPAIVQGRSSTNFALSLMLKDVNQAVTLGMELGVPMPVSNIVRGLLQMGANTLGERARLEDMIGLIESMAATRMAPQAGDDVPAPVATPSALDCGHAANGHAVKLIDIALEATCRAVTYECLAAGFKYGLRPAVMAEVLNRSSGWSAALHKISSVLVLGKAPGNLQMQLMVKDLRLAAGLGMSCGAPMTIANAARTLFEAGVNELGATANIEEMTHLYEAMSGIKFNKAGIAGSSGDSK